MDGKIGIIVSDTYLKSIVLRLFGKEVERGEIIIELLDPARMDEQGKLLEEKGVKAIIARSGGYRHTSGKVKVPLIHLKITTLDILHALKRAAAYQKEIILFLSDLEHFDMNEWKEMLPRSILIETFSEKEYIWEKFSKYLEKKERVVIVGGGIPCGYAKDFGMAYEYIGASDDSVYEKVTYAREMIRNVYEQNYQNQVLKTILDGVHDAVVAINKKGKIILFNRRAQALLKIEEKAVMDQDLLAVCPELGFLVERIDHERDQYGEVKHLKNIDITVNTSRLIVDGQVLGVLCSFQDITRLQRLEKKIRYELNKKGLVAKYRFSDMIADDEIMKETIAKAAKIALTDNTVMIYGESGTGKEMLVQSIHNTSARKHAPFVAVNCAAISESLLESELFGYEEGAFTGARKEGKPGLFELAHGGTLFLDEINSMSLNLQAKLLRVLEEKEVMRIGSDYVIPLDVRIMAAANESLKEKIESGGFRKDLFYRLSILELTVPPLRERKKDILPLFKAYLNQLAQSEIRFEMDEKTKERLVHYTWPGNVRELKNVVQRYLLFGEIELEEEELLLTEENPAGLQAEGLNPMIDLKEINRVVEEKIIEMLADRGMKKAEIAKMLGISRTALWKKTKS